MKFEVWDETGEFAAEKALLEGYLPRIRDAILASIGRPPLPEVCHVVLSDRDTHERRFPFRADLAGALTDGDGFDGEPSARGQADDERLIEQWPTYAHGIATVADPSHGFPAGVSGGADVIALDIDTLRRIAKEDGVDAAAAVAGTAAHEVSHVIRGHTRSGSPDPVHGYLSEGDAQRDSWDGLRTLLGDPTYAPLARQARVARARLKPRQPDAYQQFGGSEPDPSDAVTATERVWAVGSGRNAAALTRIDLMEIPAVPLLRGRVGVGDVVFVSAKVGTAIARGFAGGDWLWVGPWRVLRVDRRPSAPHPRDTDLVDEKLDGGKNQDLVWLTLSRMDQVGVLVDDPEDSPRPSAGLRGIAAVAQGRRDLRASAAAAGLGFMDGHAEDVRRRDLVELREGLATVTAEGDPDAIAAFEEAIAEAESRDPFADD